VGQQHLRDNHDPQPALNPVLLLLLLCESLILQVVHWVPVVFCCILPPSARSLIVSLLEKVESCSPVLGCPSLKACVWDPTGEHIRAPGEGGAAAAAGSRLGPAGLPLDSLTVLADRRIVLLYFHPANHASVCCAVPPAVPPLCPPLCAARWCQLRGL
jgi:hypothetical protein